MTDTQVIRRLLVVSTEDSTKLRSWSNVPYLFCKNLESKGLELDRLTLKECRLLRLTITVVQKMLGFFGGKRSAWTYSRSAIYFRSARTQIDRALARSKPDAILVLNFSYAPSLPQKVPLFMFCDWSFAYAIHRTCGRNPDKYERRSMEREHNLIEAADQVFVLFPLAEKYIKSFLPVAKTHYLGNVINAVIDPSLDDLVEKISNQSLLFIGKPHYLDGAKHLVAAYKKLKPKHPRLTVSIVGIESSFFDNLPEGVTCYGYLDKGNIEQCEKYYTLLRQARLFVNTTPAWAAFSATLEALYFYTPIISSKYPEIVETLGHELKCGAYCGDSEDDLEFLIEFYLDDDNIKTPALNAHEIAKVFKWENYVEKFLNIIENTATFPRLRQSDTYP